MSGGSSPIEDDLDEGSGGRRKCKSPGDESPGAECKEATGDPCRRKRKRAKSPSIRLPPGDHVMLERTPPIEPEQKPLRSGKQYFQWLIHPMGEAQFFSEIWEKKPLVIRRNDCHYYCDIFSTKEFDAILQKHPLQFTEHIDLTTYKNGIRETHNPPGRAFPAIVWDFYKNEKCSVRMMSPQTFSVPVWKMCQALQDYFHSYTSSNVYLTPPDSQGFAPHFDDIEAFILQLEGHKLWKLYAPKTPDDELPRCSSPDVKECDLCQPSLCVDLGPGDLLYFPRGWIHQASTSGTIASEYKSTPPRRRECPGMAPPKPPMDRHSLHITLSTYQNWAWVDLLAKVLPICLERLACHDINLRQGIPKDWIEGKEDGGMTAVACQMVRRLADSLTISPGVDQMAKDFLHACLPPYLAPAEKKLCVLGRSPGWGEPGNPLCPTTHIRLVRKHAFRLVNEECEWRLYTCLANTRVYHEVEPQYLELEPEVVPAMQYLQSNYPCYVTVSQLPLCDMELKVDVANQLFQQGFLLAKNGNSCCS